MSLEIRDPALGDFIISVDEYAFELYLLKLREEGKNAGEIIKIGKNSFGDFEKCLLYVIKERTRMELEKSKKLSKDTEKNFVTIKEYIEKYKVVHTEVLKFYEGFIYHYQFKKKLEEQK